MSPGPAPTQLLQQRQAGVLLHITSLPGGKEHGDLGHQAYRFVEFLTAAGFRLWQTLPLGPTHADRSPYQTLSAHAGNPLLISPDWLVDHGWLSKQERHSQTSRLDRVELAYSKFIRDTDSKVRQEYEAFVAKQAHWLEDFALFMALRNEQQGKPWTEWPEALRTRDQQALTEARQRLAQQIDCTRFSQYVFFEQWHELRNYAHQHGVRLFGDMPIFVSHDSAEVWAQRQFFAVDEQGHAKVVSGVPPDYFSETGQRWGNPHYDWKSMKADEFSWWVERVRTQAELFDVLRIDHFRGFESYWSIPAKADTALEGHWVKAPGAALLKTLQAHFPHLPLVAEDLGVITEAVNKLRTRFKLPGMKILQFAFDGRVDNPYLPHFHTPDSVVYTGTHDNDTSEGWFASLDTVTQQWVRDYLGLPAEPIHWALIRSALCSVANTAIIPMQDLLGLDSRHRMNTPGTMQDNWQWRFSWEEVPADLAPRLAHLLRLYGR